jgi:hypothetical protein
MAQSNCGSRRCGRRHEQAHPAKPLNPVREPIERCDCLAYDAHVVPLKNMFSKVVKFNAGIVDVHIPGPGPAIGTVIPPISARAASVRRAASSEGDFGEERRGTAPHSARGMPVSEAATSSATNVGDVGDLLGSSNVCRSQHDSSEGCGTGGSWSTSVMWRLRLRRLGRKSKEWSDTVEAYTVLLLLVFLPSRRSGDLPLNKNR